MDDLISRQAAGIAETRKGALMTDCVYCIGCVHYRHEARIWCNHPDRENCNGRTYWTGEHDDDEEDEDD